MEIHLKIAGLLQIALALIHVIFPKYFKWKEELSGISTMNRQMMYIHSFFIGFTLLLLGTLCVVAAPDLVHTKLGKQISFGAGIFWTARLIIQFFGYSPELWKGKKFETTVHIVFSFLWIYLSLVFFGIALGN